MMGIGTSIFVGALGAVLRYAVTASGSRNGFNVHTAGIILMIVGGIGVALSLLFWSSFAPFGRKSTTVTRREGGRTTVETHDDLAI
jgi:hypothetical protein